ncbi:VWA domain-containing protein [Flavobacterium lacus]|uniref:Ca-activated chloride channel family protein n=1 Tax=Flavobacterium lacus TaxID=1353778 RepID=A0A328X6F8_9FLAO|nr:VWA domain-containing protein [Flavobacterium lacus]RAR50918.1 Ca-activated chloride channel family protein [Flavobacterium lacus]
MENQDKLYDKMKQAAKNAEANSFPGMEKVWARVEEKLDKKEDKKVIILWKKIAVAASLLLFVSLGYQFLKSDKEIITIENPIVNENKDTIQNVSPLKIEKSKEEMVVSSDVETEKNSNVEPILKESILKNSIKKEQQVVSVFKDSLMKLNDLIALDEEKNKLVSKEIPTVKISSEEINKLTGERMITGVVMDSYNLPLSGATVLIKGTSKGTNTDFDGKFSIKAKKGETLEFSYVGMLTQTTKIDSSTNLNIALVDNGTTLEEVVVVGYGTRVAKKTTSAATSITSNEIKKGKKTNTPNKTLVWNSISDQKEFKVKAEIKKSNTQSLQGKVAGVYINDANQKYKGNNNITIRGTNSINSKNEPLIILDGQPISQKEMQVLNPNDIKDITVLKDASATSLYGSSGRNGVIVITSKSGKVEKLSKRQLKKKLKELEEAQQQAPIQWPVNDPTQDESYESFEENAFESPTTAPLSTFSIDVDNASYTNIRRFINNGQTVPKDAVRVEEMVNFFKYNYTEPTDEHPFSIHTEYSDCAWNRNHKVLKVGLQGKNIPTENLPASNLVFLVDVSGSMNDQNKLPLLKQSMKILVEQLRKKDKVSIVVYAGAAGLVLPPTSGDEKKTIIDALENLQAGGSTAGGAGIELAYKTAEENFVKNGNNRVILATDGDFNVGASSNTDMQTLIEEKRKSGVFLTCLGYGMGNYKDSKMETIANKGNGNYAYIDNIQEANRFLGKEFKGSMFAIAKDVKIQIEFNPQHVQAYRLIGYENRKLNDEDFVNDAIDAGELGSGHTVTALYEIIPTNVKSDFFKEPIDLKYSKTENSSTVFGNELATIKFRYKKPDGEKSIEMVQVIENKSIPIDKSSDDFKFSSAVAWFGLKLRDSKLVQNKDSEAIKTLAKKGLSNDEEGYKTEFIRLVETVK